MEHDLFMKTIEHYFGLGSEHKILVRLKFYRQGCLHHELVITCTRMHRKNPTIFLDSLQQLLRISGQ